MENSNPVLQLKQISKRFGGLLVLSDIHADLMPGQIVGLIGPNGAGKSTLFNIITSLYKPDTGDVFLGDKKITGTAPHVICRLGILQVFAYFLLWGLRQRKKLLQKIR